MDNRNMVGQENTVGENIISARKMRNNYGAI